MLRSCRPAQAASSLSVPSTVVPTAWLISSADRGRSAPNNRSNTPSSQEEKTTCARGKMCDQKQNKDTAGLYSTRRHRPVLQSIHLIITSPLLKYFVRKTILYVVVLYLTPCCSNVLPNIHHTTNNYIITLNYTAKNNPMQRVFILVYK